MGFSTSTNGQISNQNLKIGDTISIIAPSGVLKDYEQYMEKSISLMQSWTKCSTWINIYESYGIFLKI